MCCHNRDQSSLKVQIISENRVKKSKEQGKLRLISRRQFQFEPGKVNVAVVAYVQCYGSGYVKMLFRSLSYIMLGDSRENDDGGHIYKVGLD